MNVLSGVSSFFGLDLGASAIRVVQLKGPGPRKTLETYGQIQIDGTVTFSDAKTDRAKVAQAVKELITKAKVSTNNVVANLPSTRVFTTVIDMDRLAPEELSKTINYQADSLIPTPLAQSKIDWAIIGDSPKDPRKIEVLLSSVPNDYIEARLDMLESIGLNVVAFEPDSMALMRAVTVAGGIGSPPKLILDIGSNSSDLVVVMSGAPHLTRSIPIGWRTLVGSAMQALNVDAMQAQQYVLKFGVSRDKLEGQIFNAIIPTVNNLMAEIERSIMFFGSRYPAAKLERIIVTGRASSLPEFPLYIANQFSINVEIGNAWLNVDLPPNRQDELMSTSNSFAVAAGLAERTQ